MLGNISLIKAQIKDPDGFNKRILEYSVENFSMSGLFTFKELLCLLDFFRFVLVDVCCEVALTASLKPFWLLSYLVHLFRPLPLPSNYSPKVLNIMFQLFPRKNSFREKEEGKENVLWSDENDLFSLYELNVS